VDTASRHPLQGRFDSPGSWSMTRLVPTIDSHCDTQATEC